MSDWGIVSIIVLGTLAGFIVQILICYALFYAGNRSISDDVNIDDIDNSQQSKIHKINKGSPCESPSLSKEHSINNK